MSSLWAGIPQNHLLKGMFDSDHVRPLVGRFYSVWSYQTSINALRCL